LKLPLLGEICVNQSSSSVSEKLSISVMGVNKNKKIFPLQEIVFYF
jgi:hypothetical protein